MSIALVSLHIVAAVSWIGGMIFLSLVLAPLVRSRQAAPEFTALFRSAALRFRIVVWLAMGVLLTTGPLLLSQRGMEVTNPSTWSRVVHVKVGLVALLLSLSFLHDLVLGPRVSQVSAMPASSRTAWQQTIVRTARWLPRISLLVALAVLFAAVVLARS
jgi:putative copper export protein